MSDEINEKKDDYFDDELYLMMKSAGWIIPQTEEDVIQAEEEMELDNIAVPDSISNLSKVYKKKDNISLFAGFQDREDNSVMENNLAQAAREGKDYRKVKDKKLDNIWKLKQMHESARAEIRGKKIK